MHHQRLAISESAALGGFDKAPQIDASTLRKRAAQFKTFAVDAAEANWKNLRCSERGEIVQNRSCSARLRPHPHYIVHGPSGFDRGLFTRWINFEIAIQANISQYGHTQLGIMCRDAFEAFRSHGLRLNAPGRTLK